jgi:hypothetical protein
MTFPRQDDGAPRRGRPAAREADNFAAVIQFPAFLKTHGPRSLKDWINYGVYVSRSCEIPAVSFEQRKARADEIGIRLGGTPTWRNGYCMTVRQDAVLRTVVDFFPPILAADAEDAA